jgi:hypothetical protein
VFSTVRKRGETAAAAEAIAGMVAGGARSATIKSRGWDHGERPPVLLKGKPERVRLPRLAAALFAFIA